jgi:ABC-type phosphate transport system permease subunit
LFVFINARQPIAALNEQAWGAALLLLLFVLTINVFVRIRTFSGRRPR